MVAVGCPNRVRLKLNQIPWYKCGTTLAPSRRVSRRGYGVLQFHNFMRGFPLSCSSTVPTKNFGVWNVTKP